MEHLWYKQLSTFLVKGRTGFTKSNEKNIQNTFKIKRRDGERCFKKDVLGEIADIQSYRIIMVFRV